MFLYLSVSHSVPGEEGGSLYDTMSLHVRLVPCSFQRSLSLVPCSFHGDLCLWSHVPSGGSLGVLDSDPPRMVKSDRYSSSWNAFLVWNKKSHSMWVKLSRITIGKNMNCMKFVYIFPLHTKKFPLNTYLKAILISKLYCCLKENSTANMVKCLKKGTFGGTKWSLASLTNTCFWHYKNLTWITILIFP